MWWQVPVQDITFRVLKTPWDYDKDVALADPGALPYLSLDPSHPFNTIVAADMDMVCSHHQLGTGKLFIQSLFWQSHADNRCPVRIKSLGGVRTAGFFYVIINSNISGDIYQWCMA